jgi:malate/lactate dehydrogenase
LEQVLELSPGCSVRGGDASDVPAADVVVLCSATPLTVGTSRLEYLAGNAVIADGLAGELEAGWPGVLRTSYARHVALDSGRSSTWTSGLGVARMVSAVAGDGELWPASVVLDGEYGIEGVAVTVPVTIGRAGAGEIHEWDLEPGGLDALRASAELVRAAVESIDARETGA